MKKMGLQKFTDSKSKFEYLLQKAKLTADDLDEILNSKERIEFGQFMTDKLNNAKGMERDLILEKVDGITAKETKTQFWEYNNNRITWAISTLMQEYGRMPSKT